MSLEQLVAETDERYYAALLASTHGWHPAEHDAWPWLDYFVEQLARAYALFEERAASARSGGSKRDRVKEHVLRHAPARSRISDLRSGLPGIGDGTIRNALDDLRRDGRVDVDGPELLRELRRRLSSIRRQLLRGSGSAESGSGSAGRLPVEVPCAAPGAAVAIP